MAPPTDYLPTVNDYYRNEFGHTLRSDKEITLQSPNFPPRRVNARMYFDVQIDAKYASFYIPSGEDVLPVCEALAQHPEWAENEGVLIFYGSEGTPNRNVADMVFTNKTILSVDANLTHEEKARIRAAGRLVGANVEIRDKRYAEEKTNRKPDAFISFDWRNRESIAKPLAMSLGRMLCRVWYAEFMLKPGDNIRDSIERGLKECHKCIVIITKEYMANPGWAKTEFDSVFTRERLEKRNIIIPVWHRVTPKEVFNYCPSLHNVFAVKWINRKRVDEVAAAIKGQIAAATGT